MLVQAGLGKGLSLLTAAGMISHMCNAGGVFGLFAALTGKRMPGGAVALAEGNALGKGPVVFHLFDSGIEYIRNQAAGDIPLSSACLHDLAKTHQCIEFVTSGYTFTAVVPVLTLCVFVCTEGRPH